MKITANALSELLSIYGNPIKREDRDLCSKAIDARHLLYRAGFITNHRDHDSICTTELGDEHCERALSLDTTTPAVPPFRLDYSLEDRVERLEAITTRLLKEVGRLRG